MLEHFDWTVVMAISSFAILLCYVFSFVNESATVVLLPFSGLFMSAIYPTVNSKWISCFPKTSHGSVAGIILFFTALESTIGSLTMGVISDMFDSDAKYGFMLATLIAVILFVGFLLNMIYKPTYARISKLNESEYNNLDS